MDSTFRSLLSGFFTNNNRTGQPDKTYGEGISEFLGGLKTKLKETVIKTTTNIRYLGQANMARNAGEQLLKMDKSESKEIELQ